MISYKSKSRIFFFCSAPERANPPKPPGSGSNSKSGSDADPGLDAGKDLRTRAAAGTSRPSKSTSSRLHHLVEMRDNTTVVFRAIGKNIVDRSYLGFGTSDPKLMRTLFGKDVVDSDVVIRCLNEDGTLRDTKARMDKSGVLQMTGAFSLNSSLVMNNLGTTTLCFCCFSNWSGKKIVLLFLYIFLQRLSIISNFRKVTYLR